MAAPLLESASNVMARMGFDAGLTAHSNAILSALQAATPTLSAMLRTEFTSAAYVDHFYVVESRLLGNNQSTQLLLSAAFVAASPALAVRCFEVKSEIDASGTDITAYAMLDAERGVVRIHDYALAAQFVRVSYTAGFTSAGSPAAYASVPEWLKEAATLCAMLKLSASPVLFGKEYQKLDFGDVRAQLETIVQRHLRYVPDALSPI